MLSQRSLRVRKLLPTTERDQLLELLADTWWVRDTADWWDRRRSVWGGLSAQDLWDLGCLETVRRAVRETCTAGQMGGLYG